MSKRIGVVLALVLVIALSFSATALAKGGPSGGSVVTFERGAGVFTSSSVYEEAGVTVTGITQREIRDWDRDLDQEASLQRNIIVTVDNGATFDLTSVNIAGLGLNNSIKFFSDNGVATITGNGVATLNLSGVTFVKIIAGRGLLIPTIDDIVVNGGKGNNGKKADQVNVCHADDDGNVNIITVNGNALDAHLNYGDIQPIEIKGKLICKGLN